MREIIWSVCNGDSCLEVQGFVRSLRASGYSGEIIVWSEFEINGAESIPTNPGIEKDGRGMWKFEYLKKINELYPDALLAYFSPNHYVSHALTASFTEIMNDEPALCFLESNAVSDLIRRNEWCGINTYQLYDVSRSFGNMSDTFFNLNANHFFVKADYVNDFYQLIHEAATHLKKRDLKINDELCLSLVLNTIAKNKESINISANKNIYGIDIKGVFKDRLPDGTIWETEEWFTGRKMNVNPAIVLCPSGSSPLRNLGRTSLGSRIVAEGEKPVSKGCKGCQRSKPSNVTKQLE